MEKKQVEKHTEKGKKAKVVGTKKGPGHVGARGRTFEGTVIRKFPKRIVISFERTIYVRKYERYAKNKTKIHARVPATMEDTINVGDYVKVQECRPLSKLIHSVVIQKIRDKEEMINNKAKEKKK